MVGLVRINLCVLKLKLLLKVWSIFGSWFQQVPITFWPWSKNKSCSTHCPDHVGIGLDEWFGDFRITGITLCTHSLPTRVAGLWILKWSSCYSEHSATLGFKFGYRLTVDRIRHIGRYFGFDMFGPLDRLHFMLI